MELKQKSIKFLFLVFAFIFVVIYFSLAQFSQAKSYNFLYKLTLKNKIPSSDVVLIAIDDKSLHEIGRWPWKREYYLEIFDYLQTYTKAKVMGYDGLIMAPDLEYPLSDKKFFSSIDKFKNLTTGVAFSYDDFENNIDKNNYDKLLKEKSDVVIIDKRTKNKVKSDFKSFTALQNEYFKNVNSIGFVNVPTDSDGYIRQIAQLIDYKGTIYPSMSFLMYSKYTGIKEFILSDNYIFGFSDKYTLKIPVENKKGMTLNYICYYNLEDINYSHKKYSASDVINSYRAIKQGKKPILDPSVFDNKFVFIGANANAQALNDIARTPTSETFSGLDIQATNFDNLLSNRFFRMSSPLYNFIICLFIFILVFVLINTMPIIGALLSCTTIMLLYMFFAIFMYYNRIAISVILPLVFVVVSIACAYSYRYLMEDNKKLKIQKVMGKYLSYDVMQNVVKNIDNISLGGKRADITVLFADIRNFTSISESMDADSVSVILNEYFSALVPIIEEYNGVLNKFMGDAVLAIFGEPKKSDNHALDAVRCADKMLRKVKYLQEKWLEEGKPRIEIGIGISSGEAFIGNIGSQERLEYTVIGDTVNTASRIENYNKVYRTNFLISESTYEKVKDYVDVIIIKNVVIRGKANKINLYEVIRLID